MIHIEVCYGTATKQTLKSFAIEEGMSAIDIVKASGILEEFPEIDLTNLTLGVFSQKIERSYIPKQGERIEIYRPLIIDPMTKRRLKLK